MSLPVALPALAIAGPALFHSGLAVTGTAAITSRAGGPLIGTGIGIGVGVTTACAAGNPCGGSNEITPDLSRQLDDIYSTYPITDRYCECAAQETLKAFSDNGITGKIVESQNGSDFINRADRTPISNLGFHQAAQVTDRFYNALTGSQGATWEEYQNLFLYGDQLTINPSRPFIPPQEDEP